VFFELADCVALSLAWSPARGGLTRAGLRTVAARGEIGREGCEISSVVDHMGLSP